MSISQIEYYIPSQKLSIKQFITEVNKESIPKEFKSSSQYADFINEFLNLESIRIEPRLEAHEMIEQVVKNAINKNKFKPEDIDMIVFVPGAYTPKFENIGHYIQHKFKMTNAFVLDIGGNDCVNIEMAVKICSDLVNASNDLDNILIVAAAKVDTLDERIVGNYGIFGDASGLILINSESPQIKFLDLVNVCNGELYEANLENVHIVKHCQYAIKCLNKLILRNQLEDNSVSDVIIQNANPLLMKQCLNSKGFSENLIFTKNLSKYGHLNQLDFLVNLKDLVDQNKGVSHRKVISAGTGWAGSYVSTLMSY